MGKREERQRIYFDYNIYESIAKQRYEYDVRLKTRYNIQISVATVEEYYKAYKNIEKKESDRDATEINDLFESLKKTKESIKSVARRDVMLMPSLDRIISERTSFEERLEVISEYDTRDVVDDNGEFLDQLYKNSIKTLTVNKKEVKNYSNLSANEIWEVDELRKWIGEFPHFIQNYKAESRKNLSNKYGFLAKKIVEKLEKIRITNIEKEMYKNNSSIMFHELEAIIEYLDKGLQLNNYNGDKNINKVRSGIHDVSHTIYGTYCQFFVTDDHRLAKRVAAIYSFLGINTVVKTGNDFFDELQHSDAT